MRKAIYLLLVIFSFCTISLIAQKTDVKYYNYLKGGDVEIINSWGELRNGYSDRVFTIRVKTSGYYYLKVLGNKQISEKVAVTVNNTATDIFYPEVTGWQWLGKAGKPIKLQSGKHEIRFSSYTLAVPMIEEVYLTVNNPWLLTKPNAGDEFIQKAAALKQQPPAVFSTVDEVGDMTEKVLPNPQGIYDHLIDEAFTYSHFSYIYLGVGYHSFSTSGSTIDRALTVFLSSNYTYSWSNVNGGPGGESALNLYVGVAGYYAIMLRSVISGQSGATNILYNGSILVSSAQISGRTFAMSSLKGGPMNFFTCKLKGTSPDTRMIATRYPMSSVRGYNDDYSGGGGSWAWGLSSRIKKDFIGSDSVQYAYVCAYSPTSTGICDMYAGGGNSNLPVSEPQNFPLLPPDDAIKSAEGSYYNCIAWSGGITNDWVWPPGSLSTYNCNSSNYLQCFDNFYSNNPVRYPGAWNYTRTGATVSNAVVDLWKTAAAYTHASVKEPGNNHPHGYDWESKPGSLDRTFHPRNALTNANWYGSVSNYYIPTGTYARYAGAARGFASDADAVKAGLAIFDKAMLTEAAQTKLMKLLQKTDAAFIRQFNELYAAWDKTKAANASLSDPAMYCKNEAYERLAALGNKNALACLLLVMDKFVNSKDHIIGELLVSLANEKYGYLLAEVKNERLTKPNDEQGRYRIHGDHDNGVLYIEKILKELQEAAVIKPAVEIVAVTVSPNPVKDWFTVKIKLSQAAKVSVQAGSVQTRNTKMIMAEKEMQAGTYPYTLNAADFAGGSGDIITLRVTVNGEVKTFKVLVAK
jgi:hypothetical protein